MGRKDSFEELAFEDSLSDDWSRDMETVEVSLEGRSGRYLALATLAVIALVLGRVFWLGVVQGNYYSARAAANLNHVDRLAAPRGQIVDRFGKVLAANQPDFSAVLDLHQFVRHPEGREDVLRAAEEILGIPRAQVEAQVADARAHDSGEPIVLATQLPQSQVVALAARNLTALRAENDFKRVYTDPVNFSTVLGYVGLPTAEDLQKDPSLSTQDLVGKSGIENRYDDVLQGEPGTYLKVRDAHGNVLREERTAEPKIGATLTLAIDSEFQQYFATRVQQSLNTLGQTSGAGIAMNPQTGEILALMSFPQFSSDVMSNGEHPEEKKAMLVSPQKPLFDRAISGRYSPGSTIKPLVGVAALKEGVINPGRTIFSPGYLDIPNPYDPARPTRYLDWRPQGNVDMAAAIAQSSDVYFYEVGGGFADIKGLGITKLREWWQKFRLDQKTGIDLPAETVGFLPSPEWKEKRDGRPWLLGDSFNVSIGQGDLDVTPIELIDYVSAIANGGKVYRPLLNKDLKPEVLSDLTYLGPEIAEIQKGMRRTATSPLGTAYNMHDLPFAVNAKTGSAQVLNNTQENAFFTGYIPSSKDGVDNGSELAILILVEHSKEGSSNTLPAAKDILRWYWDHRLSADGQSAN